MDREAPVSNPSAPGTAPLRVGLVVSGFPIQSEVFVYQLALTLRDAGAEVDLLPIYGRHGTGDGDLGSLSRVRELVHMPPPMDRPGAVLRALRHPRELRVTLDEPRQWAGVVQHARLFETRPDYDVIHAQFATLGRDLLRQIDLGTLRTRALVVHLRGHDISREVREKGRHIYDELFRRADLFLANCEHFRQVALDLGCPPERCEVVGSPCDIHYFVPPEAPRPAPIGRPLRLVAVGRMVAKKGFADAVDAVGELTRRGLDVTLDLLGDGPERADLEARAAGLEGRVRFHGPATRDAVKEMLHASDIGLAPSVTAPNGDQDAPVNTLKEQMATGLPVVATRHGGIPELVIDGVNGRLVSEHAPGEIADAVEDLARDPSDWAGMGAAGRRKVIADFSSETILARTRAAYDRALAAL